VRVFLAHGASGNVASMKPWIDALKQRGFDAAAVGLPRGGGADRAVPFYRELVAKDAKRRRYNPAEAAVIGGHSFGGRVASMLAAEQPTLGLILLSYPLHRPGYPEQLRTAHWPRIACPTLLLSGESDPFARVDVLREQTKELANAQLVTYPRIGHGLLRVIDEAVGEIVEFLNRLAKAS
jgi:predicted alpha/beta-hydrolase family hydrolase